MLITAANPEATRQMLSRLWERSVPVVRKRLDLLDAAAASGANLPEDLRNEAITEAHKLAGSLGMFGYLQGTELAREIEVILETPGAPPADRLAALSAALRTTLFPPA